MRNWWRQYFTFNTGERRAIIAIVVSTIVIVAGINGYRYCVVKQNKPAEHRQNVDAFIAAYNAAEGEVQEHPAQHYTSNYKGNKDTAQQAKPITATLFKFDPNTIGIAEWMKLGFSGKQAASIEKYKAKGGRFYKVEDLKKLYVVSDDDYNRIAPYADIKFNAVAEKLVNINTADSASIEALPGIGALLTHRILEQRKQGKFKSIEELRSIKGMSEENYNKAAPHISLSQ